MMSIVFYLLFMIPLSFFSSYWLTLGYWFLFLFVFFFLIYSFDSSYLSISYMFGVDMLSYLMVVLSLWIGLLMMISSTKVYFSDSWPGLFKFMLVSLIFSLVLTFSFMNLFMFYLFFEVSLVPTLFLILGWGYQPERLQAGVYLFFYTLLVSLPMMVSLFNYYVTIGSLDFYFFYLSSSNIYMYLFMSMVFFVKIPMFLVHLWLPKAHVEAPVAGSMILAGVMLKLGGYGLMRLMKIFLMLGVKFNLIFIVISMVGGLIISFICLRQSDMKSLIAYSSVVHMGMTLAGILTLNCWGMVGGLCMMIAHGLCSSGLFCLVNISYERLHSRSLYLNKGLMSIFPSLTLWWFLLVICNMAAPPSMNLMGEILLIGSLMGYSFYMSFFLIIMSFMGAVYSLYLYSYSQHGKFYSGLYSSEVINLREYLLLFLHWMPLNIIILKSDVFMNWL
uniref:NADH-ubiquinone oxidoreductase chain 4 n=1 Tax=Ciidae sp. GENSP01 TaxID=1205545 RepID=A0A0S2MS11_9CUCU|nr:NADH deshydrogenase subunit 4 [Ciidae sp. GENSP01]